VAGIIDSRSLRGDNKAWIFSFLAGDCSWRERLGFTSFRVLVGTHRNKREARLPSSGGRPQASNLSLASHLSLHIVMEGMDACDVWTIERDLSRTAASTTR